MFDVLYYASMRYFFGFAVLFGLLFFVPTSVDAAPNGTHLLAALNTRRAAANLPPLRDSYTLRRAAVGRAEDMVRRNYFSHRSPTGQTYQAWLVGQSVRFSRTGENIARGYTTATRTIAGWDRSGRHQQNMLHPSFTHVGTAVRWMNVNGRAVLLYVAVFGRHP